MSAAGATERKLCSQCGRRWVERKPGFFAAHPGPVLCSARCRSDARTAEREWQETSDRANLLLRVAGEKVE